MVAELVVAFTDSRELFGTLEQQRRCYWIEEFVQADVPTNGPVLQDAQEYRGQLVDFRIGNEPETLAVDEKLYAELADVEANPLGELSLPGMSDVRKKRANQLAFMLMMHTRNRAI